MGQKGGELHLTNSHAWHLNSFHKVGFRQYIGARSKAYFPRRTPAAIFQKLWRNAKNLRKLPHRSKIGLNSSAYASLVTKLPRNVYSSRRMQDGMQ